MEDDPPGQKESKELSLDTISEVLDDKRMWEKFNGKQESTLHDLKIAMQQPGVVCNCTIAEYRAATVCGDVLVIKVARHKTGRYGSAKLTTNGQLTKRYVMLCFVGLYIRPPFCLGKLIDKIN